MIYLHLGISWSSFNPMIMKSMKVLLTACWLILVFLVYSCRKDEPCTPPIVKTSTITEINQTSAIGGGEIEDDGGEPVTSRGVCWGPTNTTTISGDKTSDGKGDGAFISNISGLVPGTLYYVRAYATNKIGTGYGKPISFNTNPVALAEIMTTIISGITANSAKSGGTIVSSGGGDITACGVCWSLNHEPKITDFKTTDALSGNSFTSNLTNLEFFKTYYVRAYATNSAGTVYGNEREFTTAAVPPTVTTSEVTNRSYRSATTGGEVTADGGNPVTDKGICYATHTNPKFNENNKTAGNGLGPFTVNLTGLEPNTVYHVRAYAATAADTAYGADVEFKTLESGIPIVSTKSVIWIMWPLQGEAQTGGEVLSDGGLQIIERGVCWSTQSEPTINDPHTNDGSGIGPFNSVIPWFELMPPQEFHVRAYAKNSFGVGYGLAEPFYSMCMSLIDQLEVDKILGTSVEITCIAGNCDRIRFTITNTITGAIQTVFSDVNLIGGIMPVSITVSGLTIGTSYSVDAVTEGFCEPQGSPTISFTTLNYGTVSDIEGNSYKTVRIGDQVWMAENLKTGKFSDGTTIPLVTDQSTWTNLKTSGMCFYNNEELTYKPTYGIFYNYYAVVDPHGLCPDGWHVPSDNEWKILEMYLGMSQTEADKNGTFRGTTEGGKLKELGTTHWLSPNLGATNTSGYTALPAGYRYSVGFYDINQWAIFWTSTSYDTNQAYDRGLHYNYEKIDRHYYGKLAGLSVRCIKD